jgi:hypothetical protein
MLILAVCSQLYSTYSALTSQTVSIAPEARNSGFPDAYVQAGQSGTITFVVASTTTTSAISGGGGPPPPPPPQTSTTTQLLTTTIQDATAITSTIVQNTTATTSTPTEVPEFPTGPAVLVLVIGMVLVLSNATSKPPSSDGT